MKHRARAAATPQGNPMKHNSTYIFIGAVLIWVSMYIYVPVLSPYAAHLGASDSMVGLISGVYGLLPIPMCFILGFVAGRIAKDRLFLIIGFVIASVSAFIFLVVPTVEGLLVARTIAAAASGWWVIIASAYAKYQPEDKEVKAQGVINFGSNLGKIIGCLLCLAVAQVLGMIPVFILSLAAGIIGIILMVGLRDVKTAKITATATIREQMSLFKNRDIQKFALIAGITQMISFAVPVTFTPLVASRQLAADSTMLSLIQLVYVAAVAISCLFVGTRVYKAIGGIPVLTLSFAICAISCIPDLYSSISMVCLMQVLSGICYGISLAALSGFVVEAVPNRDRTGALGVFESMYSIGIFIGPTIAGGLVSGLGYVGAYWIFFAISIAAAVLCPLLIPKRYDHMG